MNSMRTYLSPARASRAGITTARRAQTVEAAIQTEDSMMAPRHERPVPRHSGGRSLAGRIVLYLVAPIFLYYGLHQAGLTDVQALLIGAGASALSTAFTAIRKRRFDGLAVAMTTLLLLSSGVSLLSGSPRFLLARDGGITAITGIWFFASLLGKRPLTFSFARPLLEGRKLFDPTIRQWVAPTGPSWDTLWERVPAFRQLWRVTAAIWGTCTLLDAVIRVVMAYTLPIDVVPGLAGVLWPVTFMLLQVITNLYFLRAGFWPMLRGEFDPASAAPRAAA
jgi:hypothetical protein